MPWIFLQNAVALCGCALGLYFAYFAAVALLGLARKKRAFPPAAPRTRFACVVAARNEEAVIGQLVDSLRAQDYPPELYQIIVAPNNCTDATETVAAAHGARIFRPRGTIRGKGEVLTQVVDEVVLQEGFDALCVFDADNLVSRRFLARMNDALCAGAQAVQGFRDSKNPEQTAISGWYSICYWMLNRFYNSARAALGLSALVNGSGFAVSARLLRRLGGWHTVTMTEDYEFSAQCALAGQRVHWQPLAVVYDEQPLTFAQSWRQRRRWTTGSLQGLQAYGRPLLHRALAGRSAVCFDLFLTFFLPFASLAGAVLGALAAAPLAVGGSLALGRFVLRGLAALALLTGASFLLSVLATGLAALVTVLLKKGTVAGMWRGVCTFWVFAFSQTVLVLLSFVHKETRWRPIAHTSAKTLADVE